MLTRCSLCLQILIPGPDLEIAEAQEVEILRKSAFARLALPFAPSAAFWNPGYLGKAGSLWGSFSSLRTFGETQAPEDQGLDS